MKIQRYESFSSFRVFWVFGANIVGPVFISKTLIEDWRQLHCRSSNDSIGSLDGWWSNDTIDSRKHSITRAILFSCRRNDSSISHIRSLTLSTCSSSVAYLDRTFHWGGYSFAHLLQFVWLYACANWYILRQSTYLTASGIKSSATSGHPNRLWLGVNASRSSGLSLIGVNRLVFSVCSTKHNVFVNIRNVRRRWFPGIANMVF